MLHVLPLNFLKTKTKLRMQKLLKITKCSGNGTERRFHRILYFPLYLQTLVRRVLGSHITDFQENYYKEKWVYA